MVACLNGTLLFLVCKKPLEEIHTSPFFFCLILVWFLRIRLRSETLLLIERVHQITAGKAGTVQYIYILNLSGLAGGYLMYPFEE